MFDLTRQEKAILLFLTLTFVTGLGISGYKKSQDNLKLSVQPDEIDRLREESDKFIAEYSQVNINTFKIDELTRLPGVGEKLAQGIIEYHKLHGPFRNKEELMRVKGIGKKKFEKIEGLIILNTDIF